MMILLCGMIASGKSTLCNTFAERGDVVINDDSFVLALHNGRYELYNKKFKKIYKAVEVMSVMSSLIEGVNVVIDRPNFKRDTRARFVSLAKAFDTTVVCVTFEKKNPFIHAERRFNSDPRGHTFEYWLEVAQRHYALWEEPKVEEGFDNIIPADVAIQMINEGHL